MGRLRLIHPKIEKIWILMVIVLKIAAVIVITLVTLPTLTPKVIPFFMPTSTSIKKLLLIPQTMLLPTLLELLRLIVIPLIVLLTQMPKWQLVHE